MTGRFSSKIAALLVVALPIAAYLVYVSVFFVHYGYPLPHVHDEFSYLLAADTFAHFRFANPTPPAWQSFESMHINMVPAYASMYPPAQGIFLAIGQILFGHPWWGVVLSGVLFLLAAGWAFLAWFPALWALAANCAALSFLVGTYWTTSYWGGNVTALGGALILGSVGYIRTRSKTSDWTLWAFGCSVIICSRPYSGTLLVFLSIAALVRAYFLRARAGTQSIPSFFRPCLTGALPVATLSIVWLMAYCQATTGKPYLLPYMENVRQYQIRRSFHWQKDRTPPPYRHASMERAYRGLLRNEVPITEQYRLMSGKFLHLYGGRLLFLSASLLIPFSWQVGGRWIVLALAAGVAAVATIPYVHPHYTAAFASFLVATWIQGARGLFHRIPRRISRVVFPLLAVLMLLQVARRCFLPFENSPWTIQRQDIIRRLTNSGQKHLILVQYNQSYDIHFGEWVYNPADFASAPVLWARWWTPEKNAALARAYPDRKIWFLNPGSPVPKPYEPEHNSQ